MLSWLSNLWRQITGDINAVVKWITGAIAAVYSFIQREFDAAYHAALDAWNFADSLFRQAWAYIVSVYHYAVAIVDVVIHNVIVWVQRIWNDLYSYAHGVYETLVSWVDFLKHAIAVGLDDLRRFVINDVWNPLYHGLTDALRWITHEGAYVYYLLTHPDKLVALIGHYLWAAWIQLLKTYGRIIGQWLLHSMRDLAGPFLDILETILSGIL